MGEVPSLPPELPALTAEQQTDFDSDMRKFDNADVPEIHWPAPEGRHWRRVRPEDLANTPLRRAMLHRLAEALRQQKMGRDGESS